MTALTYSNPRAMTRGLGAYQSQTVETASPAKLITMLYDGGLRAIAAASSAIEDSDMDAAHTQLIKAQAIVTELSASLNMKDGGQIARSLADLYDFCNANLVKANVSKSPVPLRTVTTILTDLRDAWNEMSGNGSA
jgi:flagellar protein FliS